MISDIEVVKKRTCSRFIVLEQVLRKVIESSYR